MAAAVTADSVRKRYGETTALDGVSVSIGLSEVFALVGPNGAGKTTFVRTLSGTTTIDAGTVRVLDEPPHRVDRSRIGLLPQAFTPPTRLTPSELLAYYGGLYEKPRPIHEVLSDVGLQDSADTRYEHLSGGQQRRICVGIALVNEPDLLFLDEPTTGIDPAGRRSVWSLIRRLSDTGTTVLLTTHSMQEAEELADRVGLLNGGSLVELGPPADLIEQYGGAPRLSIETAHPPTDFPDLSFEFETTRTGIEVTGIQPTQIGDLVGTLEAHGVTVASLSWTEPTLEQAYLHLTGVQFGSERTPGGRP
jgi:ABC-2 type transport system ATP-binding protein